MFEKVSKFSNSILLATIFILGLCGFIIVTTLYFYYKRRRDYHAQMLMKSEFQKTLLHTQLEIRENTLRSISQEIHDNIGQMLTLAKLNLNTLVSVIEEKDLNKIRDTRELIAKTLQDLRDLSRSLNPDSIASVGLAKTVEIELLRIQRTIDIETNLEIYGQVVFIASDKELILFRIIQEAINNVVKHSHASKLNIEIRFDSEEMLITISDNGKGFNLSDRQLDGSGLRNIESRSALIGAHLVINSRINKGTVINIHLPLANKSF